MGKTPEASAPDFSQGVSLTEIPSRGMLAGHGGDEPVLLSRFDGELFAVAGVCTHYGALLAGGLVDSSKLCVRDALGAGVPRAVAGSWCDTFWAVVRHLEPQKEVAPA